MSDTQGLQIIVGADVQQVADGMATAEASVQQLQQQLNILGETITHALDRGEDVAQLEDAFDSLNTKIKELKSAGGGSITSGIGNELQSLEGPISSAKSGFAGLGLTMGQSRVAFLDLGRIVTGQGFSLRSLASNFSLLGPTLTIAAAAIYGLVELFSRQTDEEKKAGEEAKRLAETLLNLKSASDITSSSSGSEEGNISRVQALAAAIQDTNNTYAERQNALNQLRETNKAYFGDLTLETASMVTLSEKVREYSQALITEAIVKGQVDEIAKVSAELQVQVDVLNKLKDARDRAQTASAANPVVDNPAGGLGNVGQNRDAATASNAVVSTTKAWTAQQEVVDKLSTSVAAYRGELDKAIEEQIKQKPLTVPPKTVDDLKSIIPVLEQIQKIYADIQKPSKEPLFKQLSDASNASGLSVIEAQIREAIRKGATEGATDPAIASAYQQLATALQAKLAHVQNPNLSSSISYTLADPSKTSTSEIESKVEKEFGDKDIEIKVPVHLLLDIKESGQFNTEDSKKIAEQLEKDPALANMYINATADVKLTIGKFELQQAALANIKNVVTKSVSGAAEAGFADVGKLLGDVLTGQKNPFQKAIQNFTSVLGEGLIKIGESMIEASTIMQALNTALGKLDIDPAGGIVEGIAAVALGEVVKDVGMHAFAEGGIVTGPTIGLIGEAGPEVVFPLSKLNDFASSFQRGAGDMNVRVEGQISGQNLLLVQARATKNANLVSKAS